MQHRARGQIALDPLHALPLGNFDRTAICAGVSTVPVTYDARVGIDVYLGTFNHTSAIRRP